MHQLVQIKPTLASGFYPNTLWIPCRRVSGILIISVGAPSPGPGREVTGRRDWTLLIMENEGKLPLGAAKSQD